MALDHQWTSVPCLVCSELRIFSVNTLPPFPPHFWPDNFSEAFKIIRNLRIMFKNVDRIVGNKALTMLSRADTVNYDPSAYVSQLRARGEFAT